MFGTRSTLAPYVGVAVGVAVILVLWVFPGFLASGSGCSLAPTINGHLYCAETDRVVERQPCGDLYCTLLSPLSFFGVSFQLELINSTGGPTIEGHVWESNTTHFFELWANGFGPKSLNWTSGDGIAFVQWQTPFISCWPVGVMGANVTCGVLYSTLTSVETG
jgi:hypothetical protein